MEPSLPIFIPTPADAQDYDDAYQRVRPKIEAVQESELLPVNLDIPTAALVVIGQHARLRALRETIAAEVPNFDLERFDAMADFAKAAWHCHTNYQTALRPPRSLQELGEVASRQREVLLADLKALIARGIVSADRVADVDTPNGYLAIAKGLFALVQIFRTNAAAIAGKTAVTMAELDSAAHTAVSLAEALSQRGSGVPTDAADALLLRQRAYTLMINAYDDARRVVLFLRWHHDDADDIAPSLWAGRGGRGSKQTEAANASAAQPASPRPPTTPLAVPAAAPGAPVTEPFVS